MLYSSQIRALTDRRSLLRNMMLMGGAAASAPVLTACAQESEPPSAAAPAPASPPPEMGPTEVRIDFSDPAQNLRAFIKVLGNLDPTVETVSWFGGDIFAVTAPDKPLVKLFGVEGMGVLRTEAQDDGAYRLFNRECAFYKDPLTGQYIDTWTNPFTQEEVKVVSIHNMTVNAEVAPIFKMDFDGKVQEIPFAPPWWIQEKIDTAMNMFEVHVAPPSPMSRSLTSTVASLTRRRSIWYSSASHRTMWRGNLRCSSMSVRGGLPSSASASPSCCSAARDSGKLAIIRPEREMSRVSTAMPEDLVKAWMIGNRE